MYDSGSALVARLRAAASVAQSGYDPYTSVTSPADLAALVALNHAKGVAAHSGPYPIVGGTGPVGPVMRSTDIVTSV